MQLLELLKSGFSEDKQDWSAALKEFFIYRHSILNGERPFIPLELRNEALQHLHAAHHGVTSMHARAGHSV